MKTVLCRAGNVCRFFRSILRFFLDLQKNALIGCIMIRKESMWNLFSNCEEIITIN